MKFLTKTLHTLLACISIIVITNCTFNDSKRTTQTFKEINESIRKSNESISYNSNQLLQKVTDAPNITKETKEAAIALANIKDSITNTITELQLQLKALDSSGVENYVSYKYLVQENNLHHLERLMVSFYQKSLEFSPSTISKDSIDIYFQTGLRMYIKQNSKRQEDTFNQDLPTIAAITILTKYEYDTENILQFLLGEIIKT